MKTIRIDFAEFVEDASRYYGYKVTQFSLQGERAYPRRKIRLSCYVNRAYTELILTKHEFRIATRGKDIYDFDKGDVFALCAKMIQRYRLERFEESEQNHAKE